MADGPERKARDEVLAHVDWDDPNSDVEYLWANLKYLRSLLRFDAVAVAQRHFDEWRKKELRA